MKHKFGFFLGVWVFIAAIAIFGLAVMFLWNGLLPDIFGIPAINYWQAAGLLILARILFGGINGGMIFHAFTHRNPFRDKWLGMSKSEQEDFLKNHYHGFRDHFHGHRDMGDTDTTNSETKKE